MNRRTMLKMCAAAPLAAQPARALSLNRPSWDGKRWRVTFLDFTSRLNVPGHMFERWIMVVIPLGFESFTILGEPSCSECKLPAVPFDRLPRIELLCSEASTWFHRLEFITPLVVLPGETLRLDLGQRIGDREGPLSVEHLRDAAKYPTNVVFSHAQTHKRTFTFG